jgi:hypothetical protein
VGTISARARKRPKAQQPPPRTVTSFPLFSLCRVGPTCRARLLLPPQNRQASPTRDWCSRFNSRDCHAQSLPRALHYIAPLLLVLFAQNSPLGSPQTPRKAPPCSATVVGENCTFRTSSADATSRRDYSGEQSQPSPSSSSSATAPPRSPRRAEPAGNLPTPQNPLQR